MLNRRKFFGSSAAAALLGAVTPGRQTAAKTASYDVEPRGATGRLERLPRLDLESSEDFLTGFRIWVHEELWPAAAKRTEQILEAEGVDPDDDLELEEILELLSDDPLVGMSAHAWLRGQQVMWHQLREEFHTNAELYLAEMEATDRTGPGTLELNPEMDLPEYTKHEIHMQPGGYVGDPFAGHIYHYGTMNFWLGRNYQDELHRGFARGVPTPPANGKIKRILDMGCGTGQLTVGLKEQYPNAEVWGIDVGGPMVRFAHMRAVDLDYDVHFAQRLAEDTKFPDNHFDMVTSFLLFHEVTSEAAEKIVQEAHRILRPGGVFYPRDTRDPTLLRSPSAFDKFRSWWVWRWNHEVWMNEHRSNDYAAWMSAAGFDVDVHGSSEEPGFTANLVAVKRS